MSVAPGDCNPTRAVCRFIAQSRAGTGSFCGSVKGRPASLYVGWVSEAHPPRQAILLNNGLSPLARGTHTVSVTRALKNRFIPARAGNTQKARELVIPQSVYPRSRGEHSESSRTGHPAIGLSPLARGTHERNAVAHAAVRFIPARAGNTRYQEHGKTRHAVYPRSRGEHMQLAGVDISKPGLSPLARGTLLPPVLPCWVRRFIPARAGNTSPIDETGAQLSVYPRSRGEHYDPPWGLPRRAGLSPLARGTRENR